MRSRSVWRALVATVVSLAAVMLPSFLTMPTAWAISCTNLPQAQVEAGDALGAGFRQNATGNRESVWVNPDVNDLCERVSSIAIVHDSPFAEAEVGFMESQDQVFCNNYKYSGNHIFLYWRVVNDPQRYCTVFGAQNPGQYRNLTIQSVSNPGVFSAFLGINPPQVLGATTNLGVANGLALNNGERHTAGDSEYSQFAGEKFITASITTYSPFTDVYVYHTSAGNNYHCIWKATDSNFVTLGAETCI